MENVQLIFKGTERSKTDEVELVTWATFDNEIFISINDNYPQCIYLSKQTAVRLVRELKRQIGYLESEVNNG